MDIENIENFVKNRFGEVNWGHVQRVRKIALELSRKYNADEELVDIGVLLHDIAKGKANENYVEHHIEGAEIAEKILKENGFDEEFIGGVKRIILRHMGPFRFLEWQLELAGKPADYCEKPDTMEEKIVFDADMVDLTSEEGVKKLLLINKKNNNSLEKTIESIKKSLKDALDSAQTDEGRKMIKENLKKSEEFLGRLVS